MISREKSQKLLLRKTPRNRKYNNNVKIYNKRLEQKRLAQEQKLAQEQEKQIPKEYLQNLYVKDPEHFTEFVTKYINNEANNSTKQFKKCILSILSTFSPSDVYKYTSLVKKLISYLLRDSESLGFSGDSPKFTISERIEHLQCLVEEVFNYNNYVNLLEKLVLNNCFGDDKDDDDDSDDDDDDNDNEEDNSDDDSDDDDDLQTAIENLSDIKSNVNKEEIFKCDGNICILSNCVGPGIRFKDTKYFFCQPHTTMINFIIENQGPDSIYDVLDEINAKYGIIMPGDQYISNKFKRFLVEYKSSYNLSSLQTKKYRDYMSREPKKLRMNGSPQLLAQRILLFLSWE